jgi:indole-3-glycerol phosphate synthase
MIFKGKEVRIIAEVKITSPFGYTSKKSWDELFQIAEKSGDIISVHTDPRWGGSLELIKKARAMTNKPILAKGIHADDASLKAAFEAGADYTLVVGRIPDLEADLLKGCLIEPNSLEELKKIPHDMKVVWNSRDLDTGGLKLETFEEARRIFPGWLCQASNIKSIDDVKEGADAVLVGTDLESFLASLG